MKSTVAVLPAVFALCLLCSSQSSRPVPAPMRHAQELQAENERDFPQRSIDPAALRQEAAQLATLAGSLPADLQSVSRGLLPKEVIQKLKQIEKLSKHLRTELNQR